MEWQKGEFTITTDRSKMDIPYIHAFLSERSYWAKDIPLNLVAQSIIGSESFGVFHGDRQVGFARVITDKATTGYLADVFIDEGHRGKGLSKWLMEIILGHPELQGFRIWMLGTHDAHGLYAQFGFRPLEKPENTMSKRDLDIYTKMKEGARQ